MKVKKFNLKTDYCANYLYFNKLGCYKQCLDCKTQQLRNDFLKNKLWKQKTKH